MENLFEIPCANCEGAIYRSRGRVNENIKLAHKFYCSKFCEYKHKSKKCTVVCESVICGKVLTRSPKDVSAHNYCSRSCAAHVNNRKFSKRGPVLKVCRRCKKLMDSPSEYCSQKCRSEERRKYSPEDLIETLKKTTQKLRRVPTKREVSRGIVHACVKLFGSWNNAVVATGLIPHRSHSQRMYKRVITQARDGHCCDSVSEAIVDNWLTRNGVFHERNTVYPNTNHKADWSIKNSPVFIEYFGLAGDSVRYDAVIQEKKEICQKNGINLVEIYPEDLYPKVRIRIKLREFTSR